MALIGDFQRKGSWSVNANGSRITELAPGTSSKAPSMYGIRTDLRDEDGNGGVPSSLPSERAELQRAAAGSYGQMLWVRWVEKFATSWPISSASGHTADRWCIVVQWHLSAGGTQPSIAFEVIGDQRRINANSGNSSTNYRWVGPLDRGQEVEWRLGVLWSTGSNGRIVAIRNGVTVVNYTGQTTVQGNYNPYPKLGIYRNADRNGEAIVDVWGYQYFDADPGSFTGGTGGGTTEPPPVTVPDFAAGAGERLLGWPTGVSEFQSGSGNAKRGSVVAVDQACQLVGYALPTRGGTAPFTFRPELYQVGAADFRDEPLVAGSIGPTYTTAADAADGWRRVNLAAPILLSPGQYRPTFQFDAAGSYAITRNQGGMAYADDPYANGPADPFGAESTTFSGIDDVNGAQAVLIVKDPPPGNMAADLVTETAIEATLVPVEEPGGPGAITKVVYLLREEIVQRRVAPFELLADGSVGAELEPVGDGTFRVKPNPPTLT